MLLFPAAALAQDYAGSWVAKNSSGAVITLTLEHDGPGGVSGKLEGNGHTFDVEAEVRADGILGIVSSEQALVHLTGRVNGPTLFIVLREPGPNGEPNEQTRRVIRFSRAGAGSGAPAGDRRHAAPLGGRRHLGAAAGN